MPLFGELFVSELLKRPVLDPMGDEMGRLRDLIVIKGKVLPVVCALILEHHQTFYRLDWESVGIFNKRIISSRVYAQKLKPYTPAEDDLLVFRDILNKQIVDVNGVKVVKATDVKLEGINNLACLTAVDVGIRGRLRRFGLEQKVDNLYRLFGKTLPHNLISWKYIQPLEPRLKNITLTIPRQMLSALHPADIADIIHKVPQEYGIALFKGLEPNIAAETLQELEHDLRKSIIEALDMEQTSDIVQRMAPDDAADLLLELETEKSQEILESIKKDEAEDIQELLAHKEDTAGSLMTSDFISYPPALKISEVLEKFRQDAVEIETVYYIYVVDEEEKLVGVTSLREMLMAEPLLTLADIMETKIVKVTPEEDVEVVSDLMAKYNLVSIPVVDEEGHLEGIITVDDIMDVIEEEATDDIYKIAGTSELKFGKIEDARPFEIVRVRLPWLLLCLGGGLISSMVISSFQKSLASFVMLAAFIPVVMGMAGNAGLQVSTTMVRSLALNSVYNYWRYILKEMLSGFITAVITGIIITASAAMLKGMPMIGFIVGVAMFVSISTSTLLAVFTPLIADRIGIDPAITSGPFVTVFNDILGLTIYFTVATMFLKYL